MLLSRPKTEKNDRKAGRIREKYFIQEEYNFSGRIKNSKKPQLGIGICPIDYESSHSSSELLVLSFIVNSLI
jgi:hypothetical protein